jgi:hypothetical protein
MATLGPTAETAFAVTFLVMNLEQLLRQLLFVFLGHCAPSRKVSVQPMAAAVARSSTSWLFNCQQATGLNCQPSQNS